MASKLLKHEWQKIIAIILLVFSGIILLGAFIINQFGSAILAGKVKHAILKSTDSLYHINFNTIQLHILQGEVVLHKVSFSPDTAIYARQRQQHIAPDQLYTLHVEDLVVKHLHPFKLLFKHQLDVGEILLNAPEIYVAVHRDAEKEVKPKDNRTIYQRLSKSLKMLHVGQIRLNDIKLKYEDFSSTKPAISSFKELDFGANDLLIDSATQFDKTRFLYCCELTANLHNYTGQTANALYSYQAKLIQFSTLTRKLKIHNFSLQPLGSPASYFKKTYEDRFSVKARLLQLNNFDFQIYDVNHTIRASSLVLSQGNINVFSNPRTNPKSFSTDKSITFPNRALHLIPIKIKIDTIRIHQYAVRYDEYNTKTKQTGYITFNQINGYFYNVTNDSAALRKNHLCHVKLSARFINQAQTDLSINFNLNDSLYSYNYKGSIGPINMLAVNVATVPLASLNIKSGVAKRLDFNIQANRHMAKGKVTFLYNNLKIQLLKADTAQLKMRHLALVSLLANALIIKDNNPDYDGDVPRSANVVYQRPLNYPFFETLWRTLLMGIKPCAGLDAQTQHDVDIKSAEHDKKKFLKQQKKEARKKQKEEKRRLKKLKKEQDKARKKAQKEAKQ